MNIISNWAIPGTQLLDLTKRFHHDDIFYRADTICPTNVESIIADLGEPGFIVGDNAGFVRCSGRDIYTVPFRGLELEWLSLRESFVLSRPESTDFCFNFMINKKQINRYLLIKLIEYLELDQNTFTYTWSGLDRRFDLHSTIKEIDNDPCGWPDNFKNKILSPIELPSRWIPYLAEQLVPNLSYTNFGSTAWTWTFIFKDMVSRSAVSLITESQQEQSSCVFTEKTLYALMGMTFPIWIGGVGHADYFRSMGFDIFDDVIDHSYQWHPTLIRRCYHALVDNLAIISDLETAQRARTQHMERLIANIELIQSHDLLRIHTDRVVSKWPDSLRAPIMKLWSRLRL